MKKTILALCFCALISNAFAQHKLAQPHRATPIMGWSSWNHFAVNINEQIIKGQADAMVASGMKAAGYEFINIDDGFWGGRDKNGKIKSHPLRFPKGMKELASYIHSKGLKAGMYSDAGINTCASEWNNDSLGIGMGLYGHEYSDLKQMLIDWNYDFLKVDWCGAKTLGLDEEVCYTRIGKIVSQIRPDAIYNVCRWEFPGKWVCNIADSWRISADIRSRFENILHIIDLNADLWPYAGPGHVNDMDMLQVGRGMTDDEDKSHFSMWCMMASPLLAGNDLRYMSKETISILTNKEMIAINQDPLVYQARRLKDYGDQEVWAKPLGTTMSGKVAVALLNRSKEKTDISFNVDSIGLVAGKGYRLRNVWNKTILQGQTVSELTYEVPAHGIVVLLFSGVSAPFNVFQKK